MVVEDKKRKKKRKEKDILYNKYSNPSFQFLC